MRTRVTCSWCHTLNTLNTDGSPKLCAVCGHRADLARAYCDCDHCSRAGYDLGSRHWTEAELQELVAEVLRDLSKGRAEG